MMLYTITVLLSLTVYPSYAFVGNGLQELMARTFHPSNPELNIMTKEFKGTVIDVRLDVGKTDNSPHQRMTIQNLVLRLQDSDSGIDSIPLPGVDGPNPSTSGGKGNLQVLKSGHFIDLTGTVKAKIAPKASWELVWRQDSPAGTLLCGLDLLQDVIRNEAILPQGRIYLSFPIWKADKLQEYQERKSYVQGKAAEYLRDRDDELQKMQETSNLFAKAMHYRRAAAAVEKYLFQPVSSMALVPDTDEVLHIAKDLFLTRTGTVWTKGGGGWNNGQTKNTFVGAAVIAKPTVATSKDDTQQHLWGAGVIAP